MVGSNLITDFLCVEEKKNGQFQSENYSSNESITWVDDQ